MLDRVEQLLEELVEGHDLPQPLAQGLQTSLQLQPARDERAVHGVLDPVANRLKEQQQRERGHEHVEDEEIELEPDPDANRCEEAGEAGRHQRQRDGVAQQLSQVRDAHLSHVQVPRVQEEERREQRPDHGELEAPHPQVEQRTGEDPHMRDREIAESREVGRLRRVRRREANEQRRAEAQPRERPGVGSDLHDPSLCSRGERRYP